MLYRILVTNKELTWFGIIDCAKCVMCGENNYWTCILRMSVILEIMWWVSSMSFNGSIATPTTNLSDKQTKDLHLLLQNNAKETRFVWTHIQIYNPAWNRHITWRDYVALPPDIYTCTTLESQKYCLKLLQTTLFFLHFSILLQHCITFVSWYYQ